jgi:transposase InsO family protein
MQIRLAQKDDQRRIQPIKGNHRTESREYRMPETGEPTISDAQFRGIVTRELNRSATEDEIALLKRLHTRWREVLVELRSHAESHIGLINKDIAIEHQRCLEMGPSGKHVWFQNKIALEQRRAAAGNFIRKVQVRLAQIRSLRQQEAAVVRSDDMTYWRMRAKQLTHLCNEIMQAEIAKEGGNDWMLVQRIQVALAKLPEAPYAEQHVSA